MADQPDIFTLMQRAEQATFLLDFPLLKEVLDKLRHNALNSLTLRKPNDFEAQVDMAMVRAIDSIRAELQTIVNDPKMAQHASKMKRRFGGEKHGRT